MKYYVYYTGSTKQASDYKTTTEFIINFIKGKFNYGSDIVELLRNLKYEDTVKWYPKLEVSIATESSINVTETRQYKLKYKAMLDATVNHEEVSISNKTKAYSIILE